MSIAAGASTAAVRRLLAHHDGPGVERQVSTDQANVSIAVDEQHLVKWFSRAISPRDLAVLERLRDEGFTHMPRYVGALVDGGEVTATVTELVPGATDGWQWYVADVLAWLDGDAPLEPLLQTAAEMGTITAELHHALAVDPPVAASLDDVRAWAADRQRVAFEHTTGAAGERLRARRHQIDDALDALERAGAVPMQWIHGDLHAGQFLRAGDRLLLTDFDGDPLTESADRLRVQPVERDVAGLLQSLDHVGRVAAKRRPGAVVEPFVDGAIDRALASYRAEHAVDDELLWALRVAQELHELAYAAVRLPVWLYVPDAALQALFPEEDDHR